jgi:hypothetical protein
MVPFSETEAYYYDITKGGDDAVIFTNAFRRLYTIPGGVMTPGITQQTVKNGSNFEVAISMRKNGTADAYRFFPDHGVATCVLTSRTFTRDGATMNTGAVYVKCQNAVIDSLYSCVHPDQVSPLANLRITHTVTAQKIKADVTIEFLDEVQIDNGYSIMNTTAMSSPRLAAVGAGGLPVPVTLTGSNQAAPNSGRVTNMAFGKAANSTVILADWSGNLSRVLNNREFTAGTFFQWFVNTTNKFYNQPFSNCVIPAGRIFSWSGEWRLAQWASLVGA